MAETAAAILQLAELATKSALQLYELFSVIKNAPQEIITISRDVHTFHTLVCGLEKSLRSDTVRFIVDRDPEISKALQTLETPMENCRIAFDRIMQKLKPHIKVDTMVQSPVSESGSDRSIQVQRARISRTDVAWFFRRKEVYTLARELERTKSTFGDAMRSITFLLTLKTSFAVSGQRCLPGGYEFSDDLGSVLTKYAESVVDYQPDDDHPSSVSHTDLSIGSVTLQTPSLRSDVEAAEELKKVILNGSDFLAKAVLQQVHVDVRDRNGRTALSYAAEHGKFEMAKLLLEAGASVSIRQWSLSGWPDGYDPYFHSGATPIYWAARNGRLRILELILQHGTNPNTRTTPGRTPLHEACQRNHIECVRLLLSKKADVNARSYSDGWSPLHEAVYNGHAELTKLLLDHGALPDIPLIQPDSKTPLHFAADKQRLGILQLLLRWGADPNSLMLEDMTPLHLAAAGGWAPGISEIVDSGAFIDARDALLHETPLHKAARNRETKAIEELCRLGANSQARNVDGLTYQEILEFAIARPVEWRVGKHLATFVSKNMWWVHE
ncbi:hypothetical protein SI65_09477 [Aspergillus cristatus]|uniref:Uncharacterized protein n=1 Tax=Aspergillus cristatus TaxID=573508 RepID=A0A1E3B220_ASPCR|nr:hypothetical protein SI65_09477 [Aspergillus cristatus]